MKSKDIGILYPTVPKRGSGRGDRMKASQRDESQDRLQSLRRPASMMGIQKVKSTYEIVNKDDESLKAALQTDKKGSFLIYEAQFSFDMIHQFAKQKNIEKGKLSFFIEIGNGRIPGNEQDQFNKGSWSRGAAGMTQCGVGRTGGGRGSSMGGMSRGTPPSGMDPSQMIEEIYIKSLLSDSP
jgi:hypothetical protein